MQLRRFPDNYLSWIKVGWADKTASFVNKVPMENIIVFHISLLKGLVMDCRRNNLVSQS